MRPQNIDDILSKLPGAYQSGDEYIASCPLQGHNTPKGHLTLKDTGDKALIICHGGKHSYTEICQFFGYESLTYSPNGNGNKQHNLPIKTTCWDITDSSENLIAQHIRYDYSDNSKSYIWKRNGVNNLGGLHTQDLPLYGLKWALKDSQQDWIICEGEKATDSLHDAGYISLGTVTGANSCPSEESLSVLKNCKNRVILWPDNDKPGKSHMNNISITLSNLGIQPYIVNWQDAPPKGDAYNFIKSGGDIKTLLDSVIKWQPNTSIDNDNLNLVCLADVEPETVSWLWFPYIPKGKLTLLEGDPGVGKSWVSLAIATAISNGKGLQFSNDAKPENVLLASAEDGLGDTIRPRLDRMNACVKNIHAVKGPLDFGNEGIIQLQLYIEKIHPALVIVDPLVAYIGAGVDIHRSNETRAVMSQLAEIAESYNVAIMAVRHLTKGGSSKPIYRGLGSIDIVAACRSSLLAGCDPDYPQKRGLVHIKSNLAPMGKAIGYKVDENGFSWTGDSDLTASKILAAEDSNEGKSAVDEAVEFLKDELKSEPVEAAQIWLDVKNNGLSSATINRAKAMLGIITKRQGEAGRRGGGKFVWELPKDTVLDDQKDLDYQGYKVGNFDNQKQNSFDNNVKSKIIDNLNISFFGISIEEVIDLWIKQGSPVIDLGHGEKTDDLIKTLHYSGIQEHHLEAIKTWLKRMESL